MAEQALAVQEYESWQVMKQVPAKRKAVGSDTEPSIQWKKKKTSGSLQTKNAVQALNEYKPGMNRLVPGVVSNEELCATNEVFERVELLELFTVFMPANSSSTVTSYHSLGDYPATLHGS